MKIQPLAATAQAIFTRQKAQRAQKKNGFAPSAPLCGKTNPCPPAVKIG